jgi:very-short-patch-repair endonuclease
MMGSAHARIAGIATGQLGLVTRRQLLEAGIGPGVIARAVRSGWLRRMHRGVYAVGPVAAPGAREMAAVLACGPEAAVSHSSAAVLLELLRPHGRSGPVHVKVAGRDCGRMPGIRAHRVAFLDPADVTTCNGIPTTTPLRTILDLAAAAAAARMSVRAVEKVIARAERTGLVTLDELRAAITTLRGQQGVQVLRSVLEILGDGAFTRSEAEEALLALIREARIEVPQTNVLVMGFEVDFFWPDHRLVAEVDGYDHHSSTGSFRADRRRDRRLTTAGYRVIRLTWADVTKARLNTVAVIAAALGPDAIS